MQPEPKPKGVRGLSDANFGGCILASHLRHQPRPPLRRQPINQWRSLRCDWELRSSLDAPRDQREYGLREDRRDAVPDHSKTVPDRRMEPEMVRKALETRSLSNGNDSVLFRVDRAHRLVRAAIVACAGAECRALAIPSQSRMPSDDIDTTRFN